ncbi:trichoplein keratin filament-binding protein [Camelus ferus]|nr:trichoplein keratin filament-binding protein [Camelus ferus]
MALPTLPSSWCSRRLLDQQAARQRHREQEARLRQQWDQNSRYFKVSDICSSKQAEWSSKTSYQRSMHAYQREKMKEEGRRRLEARRQRLRQLLLEEQDLLARELEELRLSMNLRERRIRERHENLKSAREEQRKLIAEQLLYEHWKKNDPKLREQDTAKEEEEKQCENEYETARREALERMRAEEERRQLEGKLQAEALRQQMEELKVKEMEATKLKKVQENLLKQRWELERLEEERKQMAALRQKAELGRFLRHQYNVQLNRRTRQIQEELEADRRILQALLEEEDENQRAHLARREQALADVAWMKQVIEEQLQLEREREAELQTLLREEAKEMWEKREAEWARERSARDRLMSEVAERQLQAWEAEQQEEEEEEEVRQAEQLTDALLQQEAKMMAQQGYQPKLSGLPGNLVGDRVHSKKGLGTAGPSGHLAALKRCQTEAGSLVVRSVWEADGTVRAGAPAAAEPQGPDWLELLSLTDIPELLGTDAVGTVSTESQDGEISDMQLPDSFICSVLVFGSL